jgi:hypothetical protein
VSIIFKRRVEGAYPARFGAIYYVYIVQNVLHSTSPRAYSAKFSNEALTSYYVIPAFFLSVKWKNESSVRIIQPEFPLI